MIPEMRRIQEIFYTLYNYTFCKRWRVANPTLQVLLYVYARFGPVLETYHEIINKIDIEVIH